MTLEQVFPGLQNAPGAAIVSAADSMLNLTGPANAMQAEVLRNTSSRLQERIKAIEPAWHYDRLGPNDMVTGLTNEVNELRFQRATVLARAESDCWPLQAETMRFVQQRTDDAYNTGTELPKAGTLNPRLSEQEALATMSTSRSGKLRDRYKSFDIISSGTGLVRVNRREHDSSGDERTYIAYPTHG